MNDIHVVFAANSAREHLSALAAHLLEHRDAILDAWRAYGDVLPGGRNVAASLSRAQFNDHIPAVLDSLSQSLQSWPAETTTVAAQLEADKVADHGVQRWQQGYSLAEVLREWGFLQMCVAAELERYASEHRSLEPTVMPNARRIWAQLCADGVTASATQFGRLQQYTERWTLSVQDTGPGLDAAPFMEIAQQLHDATSIADEAREASTDRQRDMGGATTAASVTDAASPSASHGEGVGLSIVKRLCELLEGSLELATKAGHGSTFRVVLPCKYGEK